MSNKGNNATHGGFKVTPHTYDGFTSVFYAVNSRRPEGQEIFNAGMRAGRDIVWPKDLINNPDNQEMLFIDKTLVTDLLKLLTPFDATAQIHEQLTAVLEQKTAPVVVAGKSLDMTDPFNWMRAEFVEDSAKSSGFTNVESCCDVPGKFCSSDLWKGDLRAFAVSIARITSARVKHEEVLRQIHARRPE